MTMHLITRVMNDGKEMVLEDWHTHGFTVPAGFITDGASVPQAFWSILPPYKRTKKAAVLHDYLTKIAKNKAERLAADKIFKRLLGEAGIGPIRRQLAYMAVRLGAVFGAGEGRLEDSMGKEYRKKKLEKNWNRNPRP